jgi:predicted secreted acid phosphatase
MYGEWEKAAFRNDYGKSPAEKLKALKSAIKDNY